MRLTDTRDGYGLVSIILHWLIAGFIAAQLVTGQLFEAYEKMPQEQQLKMFHIGIGVIAALFIIGRMVWRILQGAPDKIDDKPIFHLLSRAVQGLLLLAMLGAVVTGVFGVWSGGKPINVFNVLSLPSPMERNRELHHLLEEVHEFFGNVMIPLIIIHLLGVLKHVFINRDGVAARMIFPTRDA